MPDSSPPFSPGRDDLGAFERAFLASALPLERIVTFVACALATGLGFYFLKLSAELNPTNEIEAFPEYIAIGFFLMGFFCLLAGLLYRSRSSRVLLFADGLALEHNGKVQALRWDELESWQPSEKKDGPFRISTLRGRDFPIEAATPGFAELTTAIRQRAAEPILRRHAAALAQGAALLSFGPLSLAQDGLRYQLDFLPWTDLARIYCDEVGLRSLTLEATPGSNSPTLRIPAAEIPSLEVCVRLIAQLAPHSHAIEPVYS